jgi:hypothetical protein
LLPDWLALHSWWSYVCAGGFGFGKRPEGTGLADFAAEHCKVIEKEKVLPRREWVFH